MPSVDSEDLRLEVAVIGAGFSGLYMLYKLRELGFRAMVFDRDDQIGGTWHANRYPGARCDIESLQYSFSFDEGLVRDWTWSERFATQPEILQYINYVADRFDLRRDIQLKTLIVSAEFDEALTLWRLTTAAGNLILCRYCVMATGVLSAAKVPEIAGGDRFKGLSLHTNDWPRGGVDLAGMRVGVIGTGSSGIQAIPEIAKQAEHLYVFQRTPTFSVPARNAKLTLDQIADWKSKHAEMRKISRNASSTGTVIDVPQAMAMDLSETERTAAYERAWERGGADFAYTFRDLIVSADANESAAEFVRDKIRAIVQNGTTAESLIPRGFPIFTKRICVDTDYYETFNRENVSLVDLRQSPMVEVTEKGLLTQKRHYDLDALVYATGFDAITGALARIDIRGAGARSLRDKWRDTPMAYLGLMVAGFPNMFIINGPGSPSVLSNMVVSIEQHVEWIADALAHLRARSIVQMEATEDAERRWQKTVADAAEATLYPRAASWYTGANVLGKPRVFMPFTGGVARYGRICDDVASNGYEGFSFTEALAMSGSAF